MVEGGETEKKKYFCLHCGNVFESEKDAPYCPNCRRKRVIPLELLGSSIEKHRDKLKELGVLPEPDPEPMDPEPQDAKVEEPTVKVTDSNNVETPTSGSEVEQKVEEPKSDPDPDDLESVKDAENSKPENSSDDVPESDKLLAKYLEELEDVPEKPKKSKSRKRKKSITVPVGPSLIEVLIILGAIILLWKWWSSRTPKSDDAETNVPRSSGVLSQIQRNLGPTTVVG